ncbi:type II toxin-antitoxin system HicB family antitoxin [Carnimonas bestiolae]|uniref:type II toxin-antitoxin system HicB family antitoxin n=1 Tax=Carnimonas bestiolae TaxID=3402172 RepID=UPI003EDC3596
MSSKVLKYKGYQGSVEVSLDDGIMFGKVLHITDLVSYEGSTVSELKQAFESQLDAYLEFCQEEGIDPDKPYSGTFNVRVPPEIHEAAAKASSREGISLNDYVFRSLKRCIDHPDEQLAVSHTHVHKHIVEKDADYSTSMYIEELVRNSGGYSIIGTRATVQ